MNPALVKNLYMYSKQNFKNFQIPQIEMFTHNVLNFLLLHVRYSNMKVTQ